MTIPELLQKHGLDKVDLLKMDIEGSEFALFKSPEWLNVVLAICMEVHPDYGNVQDIIRTLTQHRFAVVAGDTIFRHTDDPQQVSFIWAWKEEFPEAPRPR